MTNYAQLEARHAWLGTEFGESFARRHFGDELIENSPKFVKGKNKGKYKAQIEWLKVIKGGWLNGDGYSSPGHVENRVGQIIACRLVIRPWGSEKVEVLASTGESVRLAGSNF